MAHQAPAAAVVAADGQRIVEVVGDIDLASAGLVERAIGDLVSGGAGEIVVDVSQVTFIDSSGLAVLIRAARGDRPFRLRRPSPAVAELLALAGLTDTLPVEGRSGS